MIHETNNCTCCEPGGGRPWPGPDPNHNDSLGAAPEVAGAFPTAWPQRGGSNESPPPPPPPPSPSLPRPAATEDGRPDLIDPPPPMDAKESPPPFTRPKLLFPWGEEGGTPPRIDMDGPTTTILLSPPCFPAAETRALSSAKASQKARWVMKLSRLLMSPKPTYASHFPWAFLHYHLYL